MTMSIPLNVLIPVTGSVVNSGFNQYTLAGLCLTKNTIIPNDGVNNVQKFYNAASVGTYFGLSSAEYAFAVNYFNSYTNTTTLPPYIYFGLYIDVALAPYTRGSAVTNTSLAALQAITTGTLTVDFNGAPVTTAAMDLSAITSYSDAAVIIAAALVTAGILGATCTWDSTTQAFTISNGITGSSETVTYCSNGTVAAAMNIEQSQGAVLSQGSDIVTPQTNLTTLANITSDWATFTNLWTLADSPYTVQIAFCDWISSQNNQFAYVLWSTETNLTIPNNTSNVAHALVTAGYGTLANDQITFNVPIYPNYGLVNLAAAIMGTAASINYNNVNSVISFAYKSYAGITPLVNTQTAYQALLANSFNFYGVFNSAANSYNFTQTGVLGGIYKWFDFLTNQLWLANQIQSSIAAFFANAKLVPNDQLGYNQIIQIINGVMQQATNNGVVTVGNQFSAATIAILTSQAGYPINSFLTKKGWYLQIIPVAPDLRVERMPPTTTLWYTNAGSILTLPITTTLVF